MTQKPHRQCTRSMIKMNKIINNVVCFFSAGFLLTSIALTTEIYAEDNEVYFVGKVAANGASSQVGHSGKAIYLRWDLIEGDFPDEIQKIVLMKNDVVLLEENSNQIMTADEIEAIYAGDAQKQRLLNTITLLKQYVLNNSQAVAGGDFNASNYATKLAEILNNPTEHDGWIKLASRVNFNIARARYRAFIDPVVSANPVYTLQAIDINGRKALIGQILIDTNLPTQILPVSNFKQVANESCSVADSMKDHNTVVLDWDAAGTGELDYSVTDNTANAIQLAGYHLHRTTTNLPVGDIAVPEINLASLAASVGHDQRGNVSLVTSNGYTLERVNDYLLITEGKESLQQETQGTLLDESDAAFFETPEQLTLAGLKPGDIRAYYIVPVDFAGHMGDTRGTLVTVPDKTRPATPWNVDFRIKGTAEPKAMLQWDKSTLENYTQQHSDSWVICSEVDGKVAFAADQASCDNPSHTRLNISDYIVYRFDNSTQAINFHDSDGDGVSDADERATGSQCDVDNIAAGKNYRLNTTSADIENIGNKLSFSDPTLVESSNIGKVFWYRLASKTTDGRISYLSVPVKGVFHDIFTLAKPEVTAEVIGNCCEVTQIGKEVTEPWSFVDNIGEHTSISLDYSDDSLSPSQSISIADFADPQSDVCYEPISEPSQSPIENFWGVNANRVLIYAGVSSDPNAQSYCKVSLHHDMKLCKGGAWQLSKKDCDQPLTDGEMLVPNSTVLYRLSSSEPGSCIDVIEEIDGEETRVSSSCGKANSTLLEFEASPGFCGYAVARDASGNTSPWAELPCSHAASVNPPNPPQLISLAANTNTAVYSWRLPLDPVAVTLVELSSDLSPEFDASDRQIISVPSAGFEPGRIFEDYSSAIHLLQGSRDQWCVRMKVIAPIAANSTEPLSSEWSNKMCRIRRANNIVSTEYLPWPKVDNLSVTTDLPLLLASNIAAEGSSMSYETMPIMINFGARTIDGQNCIIHNITETVEAEPLFFGRDLVCNSMAETIKQTMLPDLPFVLYRQAETSDGVRGNWIQVSPVIDKVHWHQQFIKGDSNNSWKLDDPYFRLFRTPEMPDTAWYLSYLDSYPYNASYKYRYQMVIFSEQRAIRKIRQSTWIQTQTVSESTAGANQ